MVESRKGPHGRQPSASKRQVPQPAAAEAMDEIVLTVRPATDDVVKVERLDRAGQRKELSEQECAELAGGNELDELVVAVQEAYEAGVAKGLDQDDDDDEADEDLVIRQLLTENPIAVGALRRTMRRALLQRLLLRRLLKRRLLYPPTSQERKRKPDKGGTTVTQNGSAPKSDPQ